MPKPSKIALLPETLRHDLEQWIIEHSYGGYVAAAAWLIERGRAMGIEQARLPRKSVLHEFGAKLKAKLERIEAATRASLIIAKLFPDDADSRGAAVIGMVQTEIFNLLVTLQGAKDADPEEHLKLLSRVARSISDLSRASVNQKKWQADVQAKAEAAAVQAADIGKRGGLSEDTADQIRRLILGIVK